MHVRGFMTRAEDVTTCEGKDPIEKVLDLLLDKKISAVVVLKGDKAVGIVTKTDITMGFKLQLALDSPVENIMATSIVTVKSSAPRDEAAAIIEKNKIHHLIVVGLMGEFVGLVSSWDITKECVRDGQAWPWNRQEGSSWTWHGKVLQVSTPGA
mmetsp:Transcript_4267/g.5821  ORF Transcript_4267/g.5821 Transcript_4267/m.5821 type:complete len:154 (-) Transcript_4267:352-813(-)|eukprot:CAMPEP_0185728848 /NCGR_PEP_ID=MMETSP1171-20130828/4256_1 /TAXON_ID=374046 /ORGANISM="Helicotheca tamensis, Strain CCMP826" /LENGTH=153 /DNA_ID=CAMNT_0028397597 /DNA_START=51 /DNA_END=512 /DNA_ORIENTATION=+